MVHLKRNLLSVALASATMMLMAQAHAQTAPAADQGDQAEQTAAAKKKAKDAKNLDTVVVTGIRGGIERAIDTKKNATSIVEAVSAEDIGKLPDVSIAESIARLPGLAAQRVAGRAQVISVRGLSPDFATTLLNGRELVSTGDNRSVEFDQYPSELVAGVTVYKTPDAALVGQGLSGTLDMRTVRPLDYDKSVLAVSGRLSAQFAGFGRECRCQRQPLQRQLHRPVRRSQGGLLDRLFALRHANPGKPGRPVRAVAGDRRQLAPGRAGRHVLLRRHQGLASHRLHQARRRHGDAGVPAVGCLDQHARCVPFRSQAGIHRQPVRGQPRRLQRRLRPHQRHQRRRSTAMAPSPVAPPANLYPLVRGMYNKRKDTINAFGLEERVLRRSGQASWPTSAGPRPTATN